MKRLLIVSGDRGFTLAVAEALADRTQDLQGEPANPEWEVARAHTALEAFVLLDRGGLPFDAMVVDSPLPDQNPLALITRARQSSAGENLPVFLLTERGHDSHIRRAAAGAVGPIRFVDKPTSARSLRIHLDALEKRLCVVLAEADSDLSQRYTEALQYAGYRVEALTTGREAIERQPRLRPHAVIANLALPDVSGLTVCANVRQAAVVPAPKVVLYGQLQTLAAQRSADNADRADDFLQAPFDDDLLVERIAELIGRSAGSRPRPRRPSVCAITEDLPTGPVPASNRRQHRRVPCRIQVVIRDDSEPVQTKTLDLSPGGLFMETRDLLPVGTSLELVMDLEDGRAPVRSAGQVAWVRSGPKRGYGVQFIGMAPGDEDRLQAYVARVGRVVYEP